MKKRTMLFEQFNTASAFEALCESVTGDIKDIQGEVKDVMDELGKEGAKDDELKAAILLQAIEKDGDLEEIDPDQLKKDVKEGMTIRDQPMNEDAGGIIHAVEVAGNLLGNSAFLEFLFKKLEKLTGKPVDGEKVKGTMNKIFGALKKVTGLPGKAIGKFFSWVAKKLGADETGQKTSALLGMGALVIFLFALGVIHFPVLGSGILWWVLSLTGLVGKSTELAHIYKEVRELIKSAANKKAEAEKEVGMDAEEMKKLAQAAA